MANVLVRPHLQMQRLRRNQPPTTSGLAPMGPEGLFSELEVDNICHRLQWIQQRSAAA